MAFHHAAWGGVVGEFLSEVFLMKYVFQFCRILAFCFVGEIMHIFLSLPVPASIYGLVLLLIALKCGFVKLKQVRETGTFLTSIFPLLFVPAAAGVMNLWDSIGATIIPILLALFPVTILVMAVSATVTQRLARRGGVQ